MRSTRDGTTSFDEMTLLYSRFLRLIAILPFNGRSFASPTSLVLCAFTFTTSVIHWSMFVVYIINKTGAPAIETICETVLVVGVYGRYYLLLRRRLDFAVLLAECRSLWLVLVAEDEGDRREIRKFERKVRRLFLGLLGSSFFVTVSYSLSAFGLNLEALRANDSHRFLPSKWYADGREDMWPGYKFNFALQVIVIASGSVITSTVDTAAPLLIMFSAGYFRAVQRRLYRTYDRAMKSDVDYSRADHELLTCCRLHSRVLCYCMKINRMAQTLFFVQLACTGYNTSLIAIKLAGTDPDRYKYLSFGLLNVGQLFICQWAPDHLLDESEAISTVAYYVSYPWIHRRVGKLLVLMIARAQKPVQMTAAGVVNLSLENFGSMLKGAVSFFTMLRSFDA